MTDKYTDLTSLVDDVEESAPFRFAVRGEKFEVSLDMRPVQRKAMARAMQTEDVNELVTAIFGPEDLARLDELDLSLPQLLAIVSAVNEAMVESTGDSLGEGLAGGSSSKTTGTRSKRTSRTTSR